MRESVMKTLVTIGEAAEQTGVSAKMIRHYEEIGMLQKASRTDSGYRLYNKLQLQQLGFIRQARKLGFSLQQIDSLLALWRDPNRSSRDVKQLAEQHLQEIRQKIAELSQMEQVLQQLSSQCCGNQSPDCAILEGLAPH